MEKKKNMTAAPSFQHCKKRNNNEVHRKKSIVKCLRTVYREIGSDTGKEKLKTMDLLIFE